MLTEEYVSIGNTSGMKNRTCRAQVPTNGARCLTWFALEGGRYYERSDVLNGAERLKQQKRGIVMGS